MSLTLFFGLVGGLLVLAFVANRLVRRTGIPFWVLPRGLITAVLALEAARVLGGSWGFLLDLAFAAIVLTDLCLVVGTLRARHRTQISELSEAAPPVQL
jgi:hypothetical protein